MVNAELLVTCVINLQCVSVCCTCSVLQCVGMCCSV